MFEFTSGRFCVNRPLTGSSKYHKSSPSVSQLDFLLPSRLVLRQKNLMMMMMMSAALNKWRNVCFCLCGGETSDLKSSLVQQNVMN